ncbi:L-dopachrome tautomerase yellow-f-like [Lutzomyia longipalpis]|uniref:L-dopachrome tautomerase yellow-f-like n=1 Tax=Lutzomyia longipalpis TaxID=7200 RepID=UPI0024834F98|nr:L-dopachrome tautomerase yellow-f-like [Lutzomyia longipalpis]
MKLCSYGVFCVLAGFIGFGICANSDVESIYYWRNVNYENLPLADDAMIGPYPYYIPTNNDIIGIEYHAASGLFIASVVRIRPGIPSTQNAFCVSDYAKGTSPHIWGFPNYAVNTLKASFFHDPVSGITRSNLKGTEETDRMNITYSAGYYKYFFEDYRRGLVYGGHKKTSKKHYNYPYSTDEDYTIIDSHHPLVDNRCNRLFNVDSGVLHYSTSEQFDVQFPSLLIYELPYDGCRTRRFPLLRRVEIPRHLWEVSLGYNFISIEYIPKGSCDDVFIYVGNAFDNRLLVYDYKRNNFWNIEDSSMKPILSEANMVFNGDFDYTLVLGITSITFGWPDKDGNRIGYYSPGSSQGEYTVSSKYLRNPDKFYHKDKSDQFTLVGYGGCNSQVYKHIFDEETGVIYFAEMQSRRVSCWDTRKPFNPDNIGVVYQSDELEFVSGLLFDSAGYLWFHSSQVPIDFLTSDPLDLTKINSQTFRVKLSEAIRGTICEPPGYEYSEHYYRELDSNEENRKI